MGDKRIIWTNGVPNHLYNFGKKELQDTDDESPLICEQGYKVTLPYEPTVESFFTK